MFAYHSVPLTGVPLTVGVKALGINAERRCVIVSAENGFQTAVFTKPSFTANDPFIHFPGEDFRVLPYRDFGPIVTGEIYILSDSTTVIVTEIYRVPNS